ncbi:hypothetical protein [Flavobacterium tyrosinilyticum]|uniref:hypothetical protein n=1 Tax=Flavobacterium tyrosinilyticum TaxID=1658740 RepID=UPI0020304100|nr:hypothetical protein [Flavobacterium tyrosinilyticum]MCM0668473.1 hypothetical protein [Flavobacterium tyrosinilyticum]
MNVSYKNFEIEVINDKNYVLNSSNNLHQYQKAYCEENEFRSSSKHAVIIKEHGIEISSAIICETEGATGIHENSCIIEDDKIWILVSNKIYCLKIPSLEIIWLKEFDQFTNFCLYKLEEDLLIHGELEIFRITKNGEIIWSFGGRDIWVNPEGNEELTIEDNTILLVDFESNRYILDFDGKLLEDIPKH